MYRFPLTVLIFASACLSQSAMLFNPDTFESGTNLDWTGGTIITNVPNNGPQGSADRFLQITSFGSFGAGSKLACYNDLVNWNGNWSVFGPAAVRGWFKNMGTGTVEIRIVLHSQAGDRWTSVTPLVLSQGSGWVEHSFPINEAALTRVLGIENYASMFEAVGRTMFRHDPGVPSANGVTFEGSFGMDDIQLVKPLLLSGTVTLNNFSGSIASETVSLRVVQNGNEVASFPSVALDGSGGYALNLDLLPGNYDVFVKGSTFLTKLASAALGVTTTVDFSLINGDVDGDDEVGPGDFAILSGAFGATLGGPNYVAGADLDKDEEVGPSDFSILSANFGQFGD